MFFILIFNGNVSISMVYLELLIFENNRGNVQMKKYAKIFCLLTIIAMLIVSTGCSGERDIRSLAEDGDAWAQNELASIYLEGEDVPQDYVQAAYWFRSAAEQGFKTAQYNLARMYFNGQGVRQDHVQATYWLQLAAEQGLPEAQNNLGTMYRFGMGLPQNYEQAIYWYHLAAEQGHQRAQYNLHTMNDPGLEAFRNISSAE